jgi:sugar transferase (PEP-CTERM/EpsH1 system associated)
MLNVLVISPWLPWPPHDGARIRIGETLRFLARQHRVTLVAPIYAPAERDHVPNLERWCAGGVHAVAVSDGAAARLRRISGGVFAGVPPVQAFHRNAAVRECIRTVTSDTAFDIVQLELSFLAHYLRAVNRRGRPKTVLSMHNVETQRFDRELERAPWNARRLVLLADRYLFPDWEGRALRSVDGVVAVSETDAAWIRLQAPDAELRIVRNGVDVEFFAPRPTPARSNSVVFTGSMDYPPNIDAAVWFADQIFPGLRERLPQLRFVVVGRRPRREVQALAARPGIDVTGEVDDVRPYIGDALALVVPLRSGGGTRLKILQAMSMACPVVSTTLGAEGLEVAAEQNILLADTPRHFIESVVKLANSPELSARLGDAGRRLTVAEYDWTQCLHGLDDLYQAVLATGRH